MTLEREQEIKVGNRPSVAASISTPPVPTATAQPRQKTGGRSATKRGPSHDEVAKRAYEIWVARGSPHGSDWEDWLQAERQLRG